MIVNQEIASFADHVVLSCKLDSISIFICDRIDNNPELHYLYHVGVTEEAKQAYLNHRVFERDPYSDISIREQPEFLNNESLILPKNSKISQLTAQHTQYWQFLHDHGVNVVGASSRRFLPGLYLIIGAHCLDGKKNPSDVPIPLLDQDLRRLLDMVSEKTLESILNRKIGYDIFRNICSESSGSKSDSKINLLTPREVQIATLIHQGKQNKQIAYSTGLSEYTVDNHLRRIYRKLGVHNRTALAARFSESICSFN